MEKLKVDENGTIIEGYHPSADSAMRFIRGIDIKELLRLQESFASTALSGNDLSKILLQTLNRVLQGNAVSDRYLLGLAWFIRDTLEKSQEIKEK